MAVVANQAVAFDKSMLTACPHLGDVLRPGLILDHGQTGQNRKAGRRILKQATLQGGGVSKAQQAFAVLRPQDMRIGARTLSHISFVTPVSVERNVPPMETDGLLPTVLFQRVFISSGYRYVIFDRF
jgi:hypothetical protein